MTATIMDGKKLSQELIKQCEIILSNHKTEVRIVTLGFSKDPSYLFTRRKKIADKLGISFEYIKITPDTVVQAIKCNNNDQRVTGIVLERVAMPKICNEGTLRLLMDYHKDVEGYHPINQGLLASAQPYYVPPTALSVLELLSFYDCSLEGKHVVVLGRGKVAGRPIADLLTANQATVTLMHSRTKDPKQLLKVADIIVAAVGKENLVRASMVKKDAIVVDVGMSVDKKGQLVGDVAQDVHQVASMISLVKGGIAPIGTSVFFKQLLEVSTR